MATSARMNIAAPFTAKNTLSLNRFHLVLLRPRLFSVKNPSLCFFMGENGHCGSLSMKREEVVSTGKLRAVLGDGGAILHDAGATTLVVSGAYALVSSFHYFTRRNLIQQSLSRKLVHILSGLLFMASWPIFRELLRGPLYYVLILILSALAFWRDSPVGVISVSMMCGGDGVADIMGRRFGSLKLPYNHQKSWAGSISMFVCGFLISIGMLYYFSSLGYFQLQWDWTIQRVALVSLVATLVESLPTNGIVDDNISVPIASMVMAILIFGY